MRFKILLSKFKQIKRIKKVKKYKAFTLLEMVVTLALTSLVLLALIGIVVNLLRISAIAHNRTSLREELATYTQEFSKDIRNSLSIDTCQGEYLPTSGENSSLVSGFEVISLRTQADFDSPINTGIDGAPDFYCKFSASVNSLPVEFAWTTCPRFAAGDDTLNECDSDPLLCGDRTRDQLPQFRLCKVRLPNSDGGNFEIISSFEPVFSNDRLSLNSIAGTAATGEQAVVAFTAVASHPYSRLNSENLVNQTVVSTRNFSTSF